jgi:hypothetical protein
MATKKGITMARTSLVTVVNYDGKAARVWARNNGFKIPARGRLSADVIDAFISAGSPTFVSLVKPKAPRVKAVKVAKAPRVKRDHSLDTVAVVYIRRAMGAVVRKAIVEVPVSAAALKAVRNGGKGRPRTIDYLNAAVNAGTVSERDIVKRIVTANGAQHVAILDDNGDRSFSWQSKSDAAPAVSAHRAVVLA